MRVSHSSVFDPEKSRTKVIDQRSIAHLHVESGVDGIRKEKKDDLSRKVSKCL